MITVPSARGVITRSPMAEEAVITTKKSSGTFRLDIMCTAPETGSYNYSTIRVTVLWWDGTKTTQSYNAGYAPEYGGGVFSGIPFSFSKSVTSPYNNTNDKVLRVFMSDANGRTLGYKKNAYIEEVSVNDGIAYQDNGVSKVDVSGLSRLDRLITELNPNLTTLNRLPKSLTQIYSGNCNLTSVNVNGLTNLQVLQVYASGLTSLDVSTCTSLSRLWVQACNLTGTLTLNGLSNLSEVRCNSNPNLTSVRATGVGGAMGTYYSYSSYSNFYSGINVAGCNLSGSALDQLYTDLNTAVGPNAYLIVGYQQGGGENSDTPSIATNKGYTVLLSDGGGGPPE